MRWSPAKFCAIKINLNNYWFLTEKLYDTTHTKEGDPVPSIKIMNDFDAFLLSKKLQFEGIAVGGSALILLGVIDRATRDLDLVNQSIPEAILEAAKQFSQLHSLDENWLNNGPREITKHLPTGWQERLTPLFNGKALSFWRQSNG